MELNNDCINNSVLTFYAESAFSSAEGNKTSISKYFLKDFFYKEYEVSPVEDIDFILNDAGQQGLYFIFCWKGNLNISINHGENKIMEDYQSAIIYDSKFEGVSLPLKKDVSYHFCIIGFNLQVDISNSSYAKFRDAFFKQMDSDMQVFIGRPYLKLINYVEILSSKVNESEVSELIIEGLIYQIIGLKVEHLIESTNRKATEQFNISALELKRIYIVSTKIRQNPAFEYTIEYLCAETALSPLKLQEGFKKMFRYTAIDYVREIRLQKALELLKTTDLSVSEIVYRSLAKILCFC